MTSALLLSNVSGQASAAIAERFEGPLTSLRQEAGRVPCQRAKAAELQGRTPLELLLAGSSQTALHRHQLGALLQAYEPSLPQASAALVPHRVAPPGGEGTSHDVAVVVTPGRSLSKLASELATVFRRFLLQKLKAGSL